MIDLQINGFVGVDFNSDELEGEEDEFYMPAPMLISNNNNSDSSSDSASDSESEEFI